MREFLVKAIKGSGDVMAVILIVAIVLFVLLINPLLLMLFWNWFLIGVLHLGIAKINIWMAILISIVVSMIFN